MSKNSDFELDLDLQLLPEWARESSTVNRYAQYEGEREREKGPRRRRGEPGFRGGPRPDRDRGGRPPRGDKRSGGRGEGGGRGRPGPGGRRGARGDRPPRREEIPLPEVDVSIVPEEAGVNSLAQQIKLTGRAYPLFDIASLILKRRERFHVVFKTKRNAQGEVAQKLYTCPLDESVWLTRDEVARHVLSKHFDTLYQTEKIPTDPPKGRYTLVAQCPMSGVILGPPNLHDYHAKLRRLHAERFSRMPFEAYKARIRMVTDEAVVKQWIEEQSFRNEYTCLNVPEPLKLSSREEVEKHFTEHHLPNLAREVNEVSLPAGAEWPPMSRGLRLLAQRMLEEQRRFPLKVATVLSQQFARHGLQFFKVNRTITHVCVARPHYLNLETTVVSDGVRRIVEYIRAHNRCRRRDLLEALAPTPPAAETPAPETEAKPAPAATGEAAPATTEAQPPAEGEAKPEAAPEKAETAAAETAEPPATAAPESAAEKPAPSGGEKPQATPKPEQPKGPTPEQAAVIADLHWLIHQGHVIEFTSGHMELAPPPKPKPQPKKKARKETKPTEAASPEASPAEAKAEAKTESETPKPAEAETPSAPEAAEQPTEPPAAPSTPAEPPAASTPAPAAETPAPKASDGEATSEPSASEAAQPEPASEAPKPAPAPSAPSASEPTEDLSATAADVLGGTPAVESAPKPPAGESPTSPPLPKPEAAEQGEPSRDNQ
jgi:hypothetical protein